MSHCSAIMSYLKDCDCTYCRQRVQISDLQACNAKQAKQIAAMITASKQSIELIRSQPADVTAMAVIGLLAAVLPNPPVDPITGHPVGTDTVMAKPPFVVMTYRAAIIAGETR
jgi:hypothetical protein